MIPIRNIYYMLSYAFQTLNGQGYKEMATEDFHNVADLCAAILCKGVSLQIKQGLGREYIEKTEPLTALRGRIDISESIKTRSMLRQRLVCSYDDFSVNFPLNQIIKSTMILLLHGDIAKSRKQDMRRLLVYFGEVDALDIHDINWHVQYNRHNEQYRMLISICYLVVKGLLQTNSDGSTKLMDFLDDQRMSRLYEKFILQYFRKHFHPPLDVHASQIPWILDDDENTMLPVMQSDITLSKGNDVLIIDAKYYAHTTQTQYDVHSIHSNNQPSQGKKTLKKAGRVLINGDRVLITRNDRSKGVVNGDVGVLHVISSKRGNWKYAIRLPDGREPVWQDDSAYENFDFIELAYALTVHKAQGSECDIVLMPLSLSMGRMLNRNLLYTGISRARNKLIMFGNTQALDMATKRYLAKRKSELVYKTNRESMLVN